MGKTLVLITLLISINAFCQQFVVDSIYDLIKTNPEITYLKCCDPIKFHYKELPLRVYSELRPNKGTFAETFVLKIPEGKVCSWRGFVQVGDSWIKELFPQNHTSNEHHSYLKKIQATKKELKKVKGRVLVLARLDMRCYGHWIPDILSRLALVQMHDIGYDWIYIQYNRKYVKDALIALGINPDKIIEPDDDNFYIQADELIVPSLAVRRIPEQNDSSFSSFHSLTSYYPFWSISWLRSAFLPIVEYVDKSKFSDKIFISRKNASRKMINEDEVFDLFKAKGFVRYYLEDLSFLEQVALFNQAKIVVGAHGSGLTNIVFCNKDARIIEIFQNLLDSTFCYLAQAMNLRYDYIFTRMKDFPKIISPRSYGPFTSRDTKVPSSIIKSYIAKYLRLLSSS